MFAAVPYPVHHTHPVQTPTQECEESHPPGSRRGLRARGRQGPRRSHLVPHPGLVPFSRCPSPGPAHLHHVGSRAPVPRPSFLSHSAHRFPPACPPFCAPALCVPAPTNGHAASTSPLPPRPPAALWPTLPHVRAYVPRTCHALLPRVLPVESQFLRPRCWRCTASPADAQNQEKSDRPARTGNPPITRGVLGRRV